MLQTAALRARRHERASTVRSEVALMNKEWAEEGEELDAYFRYETEELDSPFAVRTNPTQDEIRAIAWFHV